MTVSNEEKKAQSRERYRRWYEKNKDAARERKRINMRAARARDPERYRAHGVAYRERLKRRFFEMYGDTCAGCGFDNPKALTLDHVNHNGNKERREMGERGPYRRATEKHRPEEYQVLCMNCQFIKRVDPGWENK